MQNNHRPDQRQRPARGALHGALLTLLLVALPAASRGQSITIDDFSTNQAALTLTYPPAGTSASSSVSDAGILGGERDMEIDLTGGVIAGNTVSGTVSSGFFSYSQDATITGLGKLQWDGTDGSPSLNPTGLGGVDLTVGGSQNALVFSLFFDDLPVNMTFEVFTDAGNASSLTLTTPGLLFSSTSFVLPYSAFTTTLGSGADFTNVGAITLVVGSGVSAPDLVIDFLQTTATLAATKTVAILTDVNGNGQANPGDTLRYTVVLTNPADGFGAAAAGITYANAVPANTTLVIGSVTTSQGTVTTGNTAGDGSVAVNVGSIADAASVTITFDVKIDNPLPAGIAQILCQGTVNGAGLTNVPTDDPTLPGATDPTVIPVGAAPAVIATKVAALAVDVNGDGFVNPGDTIEYTTVVTNSGNQNAAGIVFTSGIPTYTHLVVGSVTTTQGTVTVGNTAGDAGVGVNVGTIVGTGGTVTITFRVTIDNPLPAGVTQVVCQGLVTGTNIPSTPTDNPATPTPNDSTPTPIVVPQVPITDVPTLNEWGLLALVLALAMLGTKRLRKRTA
jgi:uncharacterized repeat protein (TIGR01451 family)